MHCTRMQGDANAFSLHTKAGVAGREERFWLQLLKRGQRGRKRSTALKYMYAEREDGTSAF